MTDRRLDVMGERMRTGDFDGPTLRRWYRQLDAWIDRPPNGYPSLLDKAYMRRMIVMHAMSENLPQHNVSVDRILPFSDGGLHGDVVAHYRKHEGKPVVLIGVPGGGPCELCDGRHRVTAARLEGRRIVRAVFDVIPNSGLQRLSRRKTNAEVFG